MLPMGFRPHKQQAAQQFQASDLQLAVASNSDTAQSLRQAVQQRLASLPDAEALSIEHDRINSILMEETCKLFPHKKPSDSRISAHPEFRASAKHTWQLHKQFRKPGLLHLRNIWMRWRLYASFLRASALLRKQSKALKRRFLEDQLLQAEQAAKKGDHRGLFLVAKRLGPRPAQGVSRLQDSDGSHQTVKLRWLPLSDTVKLSLLQRQTHSPGIRNQAVLNSQRHSFRSSWTDSTSARRSRGTRPPMLYGDFAQKLSANG